MGRGKTAQSRRRNQGRKLEPSAADAATAALPLGSLGATSSRTGWFLVVLNVALVLLVVFEISVVDQTYLHFAKLLRIPIGLAPAMTAVSAAVLVVTTIFKKEREEFLRRLAQSPRLPPILGVSAGLLLFPAVPATWELVNPPPVLLIIPAKGLFSRLTQANMRSGASYQLTIQQANSQTLTESDVTGIGSLLVAKEPEVWLKKNTGTITRATEVLSSYLSSLQEKDQKPFIAKWTNYPLPLPAELRREGDFKLELFRLLNGDRKRIALQQEELCRRGALQIIFLEKESAENHEPTCVR